MAIKVLVTNSKSSKEYKVVRDGNSFTINGTIIKAEKLSQSGNSILFSVGKKVYHATMKDGVVSLNTSQPNTFRVTLNSKLKSKPVKSFKEKLVAPISGRVVRVVAAAGDVVKENQGLIVIESMKMENEIRAECDALIKTIPISEGDLVEQDQVLMTFDLKKEGSSDEKKQAQDR